MKRMKLWLFLLAGLACCAAELAGVHRVYIMPMSRGMEQYLANRLVSEHVFEVVTDPKLADAVFTDRLGAGFESQLDDFTAPKNVEPPTKTAIDASSPASMLAEASNKLANPALNSSFGRSRGTLFLVDAKSRAVVWSTYDPPKGFTGKQLDRTAADVVSRLKKDLSPNKK